jgi:hypothetical protein
MRFDKLPLRGFIAVRGPYRERDNLFVRRA